MPGQKILIYLLRRDLRLADNPVFHEISSLWSKNNAPFTSVLPLYVFPAQQVEVSGFLKEGASSPYPEARSDVGNFWRCGPHRAKFLAESVYNVKKNLIKAGSDLDIHAGMLADVVREVLDAAGDDVTALWMTEEEGVEEKREERAVRKELERRGMEFRLWKDEKYFIDDRDAPFSKAGDLPDIFSNYRKQVEPLRDAPRDSLPPLQKLPPIARIKSSSVFEVPGDLDQTVSALHKPLLAKPDLKNQPKQPSSSKATTAIPFQGGEDAAQQRLEHLLKSGAMSRYKDTRNGMLGADFSSKFSAWLALGCMTARHIHHTMNAFEDGKDDKYSGAEGYGQGENKGTAAMRFELLWRDYFRLCTRKFGPRLFRESGFRNATDIRWSYDNDKLQRWLEGTTGIGLIDASQRELYLTGYTSNRTRQNVASFLSKHLGLDWRLGAEWYESCLVDYDLSSNWGNWQYNSGVGNDPREGGMGRKFNPIKQAYDYDAAGDYVKAWVEEVADESDVAKVFQHDVPNVGAQMVRIHFKPGGKGRNGGGGGGGGPNPNRGRGGRGGRGRH